tara:strand:+ start:420 stop:665 length:246 start_codon:yes stop_codon:yes gene_type:complete
MKKRAIMMKMNKKVLILVVGFIFMAILNVFQYDKMKKTDLEHQKEIDSLANEIINLKASNEYLINSIVEDEVERAKDFKNE